MATHKEPIQQLYDRLQQLLKQHQHLLKENRQLKDELAAVKQENEQVSAELEQVTLQFGLLKSAAGRLNEEDRKAIAKKLSRYIKDIEHSITLLSE